MPVADDALTPAGLWPTGVNNLAREGKQPAGSLRVADNVDLDREGGAARRQGTTSVQAGDLVHSLWSHDQLPFGLYVADGQLHALHEDERTEGLGVQVGNLPASYALINDRVLWSNAVACGLVTLDLQPRRWAPEQPSGQPALGVVAGMALQAGQYQVAVTFTDDQGRESGSTLAVVITVGDESGIELTQLPQPVGPATRTVNIYATGPNDTVLRLHSSLPAGVEQVLVGDLANGRVLATQFLEPLPAGHIVRYQNGRQYVATGREVRWSDALRYGLWNPARNRVLLPAHVDLMEPVGDGTQGAGVYVAAGERTYWLGGTKPDDYTLSIAYGHGVVPRTAVQAPGTVFGLETAAPVTAWLSRNGYFCIGLPGGQVLPLKQGAAVVDGADSGAALIRQENGMQQLIVALRAPHKQGMAVTDTAVAHVIYRQP